MAKSFKTTRKFGNMVLDCVNNRLDIIILKGNADNAYYLEKQTLKTEIKTIKRDKSLDSLRQQLKEEA